MKSPPNLDIHVIPDNNSETGYNFKNKDFKKYLFPSFKDFLITVLMLLTSTGIRVFMATLRKKLEATPNSPQYIQTHIGVGYRMIKVE